VTAEIAPWWLGRINDLDGCEADGAMHVPIPFFTALEDVTVPTAQTVFEACAGDGKARVICDGTVRKWFDGF